MAAATNITVVSMFCGLVVSVNNRSFGCNIFYSLFRFHLVYKPCTLVMYFLKQLLSMMLVCMCACICTCVTASEAINTYHLK